jgi:hypothetical protein
MKEIFIFGLNAHKMSGTALVKIYHMTNIKRKNWRGSKSLA